MLDTFEHLTYSQAVRYKANDTRLIALALLGTLAFCRSASAEWHRYLVDNTGGNVGTCVQIRSGVPHIAYYSQAGLSYAQWRPTGWQIDTVDTRTSYHNGGPSLVFDRHGNPQIAFFCGTPWLAYQDSEYWCTEPIDVDSAGDYISLGLDRAGRPHVAYTQSVGMFASRLKYAWRDSLGWHRELVDSQGGYDCVLRFDTAGRPCVAYCESWSQGALYYGCRTATGWVKDTVITDNASQCFLTLDTLGNPHISYYWADGTNFDLRYCERTSGTWRFDVVDHGLQLFKRGWDNCIARALNGSYRISYHAHNEGQLRYAHGNLGSWGIEVLDTVGLWNLFSSIALDSLDRAYIAYCDEDEGNALYLAAQVDLTGIGGRTASDPGSSTLQIRPNPGRGSVRVRAGAGCRQIEIRDTAGRKARRLAIAAGAWAEVDLRGLPAGVYFLSAAGRRRATARFVLLAR